MPSFICWFLRQFLPLQPRMGPQEWAIRLGYLLLLKSVCIEGHLVSFCGKGIVIFFPTVLLGIIKTKQTDPVRLWESRVSLESTGHKDPSSEWRCFHHFHSLLLFKAQPSPSKGEGVPFLSLTKDQQKWPRQQGEERRPLYAICSHQWWLICVVPPELSHGHYKESPHDSRPQLY